MARTGWPLSYPRTALLVVLLAVNLALVGAVTTSAVAYGPYTDAWNGGSTLRTTAASSGASVTLAHDTDTYETARANGTVAFVVEPQERYSSASRAQMRQFVDQGGTLVVASADNDTNGLLSNLGIETRIDGRPLRDERENYRGPALPVATTVVDHPLTDGVGSLTLNYGTVLNVSTDDRPVLDGERTTRILVNSSGFGYVDANGNGTLDDAERLGQRPVAAVESRGAGRVVVVGDGSVFTNAMLDREGNEQFLAALLASHERVLLDYSHGEPLPPLVYALLVVRDVPVAQFALGLVAVGGVVVWTRRQSIPLPSWPTRTEADEPESDPGRLDEAELTAYLTDRHPDWDEDRIRRVTEAIIHRREQSKDDD